MTSEPAPTRVWNRPTGVPEEMTEEDFLEVVEVFRILERWKRERDEKAAAERAT